LKLQLLVKSARLQLLSIIYIIILNPFVSTFKKNIVLYFPQAQILTNYDITLITICYVHLGLLIDTTILGYYIVIIIHDKFQYHPPLSSVWEEDLWNFSQSETFMDPSWLWQPCWMADQNKK